MLRKNLMVITILASISDIHKDSDNITGLKVDFESRSSVLDVMFRSIFDGCLYLFTYVEEICD